MNQAWRCDEAYTIDRAFRGLRAVSTARRVYAPPTLRGRMHVSSAPVINAETCARRQVERDARAAKPFVPRTPKWPGIVYHDQERKRAIKEKVHRLQAHRWRKIRYQFAHLLRFLEVACRS